MADELVWRKYQGARGLVWRGVTRGSGPRSERKWRYRIVETTFLGLTAYGLKRLMARRDVPSDLTARTVYLHDAKQLAELHVRQWRDRKPRVV